MKRSTWITLCVFVLLLGLYFVQTRHSAPTAPPPLSIDGYIGNVSEQEARSEAKDKPSPVTRIVLKRKGEVVELNRQAAEPPKPDAKPDAKPAAPADKSAAAGDKAATAKDAADAGANGAPGNAPKKP